MRRCSICLLTKELSEFNLSMSSIGRSTSHKNMYCKDCEEKYEELLIIHTNREDCPRD